MNVKLLGIVGALAMLAAACSGSDQTATFEASDDVDGAAQQVEESTEASDGESDSDSETASAEKFAAKSFDIETVSLSDDQTTSLLDVVDGDKPVVLWGWAPHCGTCMAKVADWNRFAEENPDVQVIGIGQTDSLDLAKTFHDRTQPNFDLVYATGGNVWGEAGLGFQTMTVYTADLKQNTSEVHFSDSGFLSQALAAVA